MIALWVWGMMGWIRPAAGCADEIFIAGCLAGLGLAACHDKIFIAFGLAWC